VALHKLRDEEMRLDIPVSVGGSLADLRMRVRDDPPRSKAEAPPEGRLIDLTLDLPELGRVRTSLRWTPGQVAARFAVENSAAAAALRDGLTQFVSRLTAAGFRHATADVQVDRAAVDGLDDDRDPPLPGGSILRARA
jgi:flagellar hook-length control protein FliK